MTDKGSLPAVKSFMKAPCVTFSFQRRITFAFTPSRYSLASDEVIFTASLGCIVLPRECAQNYLANLRESSLRYGQAFFIFPLWQSRTRACSSRYSLASDEVIFTASLGCIVLPRECAQNYLANLRESSLRYGQAFFIFPLWQSRTRACSWGS